MSENKKAIEVLNRIKNNEFITTGRDESLDIAIKALRTVDKIPDAIAKLENEIMASKGNLIKVYAYQNALDIIKDLFK